MSPALTLPNGCFSIVTTNAIKPTLADPQRVSPAALALEELRRNGCRILVAGRVMGDRGFLTLDDLGVPEDFSDLLEAIPESAFREDISSTAVRHNSQS